MRVVFAARADAYLTRIAAHVAQDIPAAAIAHIDRNIDKLQRQLSVRPGRVANTRELVERAPYIAAYRVDPDRVVIRHVGRLWPERF